MSPRTFEFALFGLKLRVLRWTVWPFSLLAVIGVAVGIYKQLYPDDLVSLQAANHALSVEIQEYGRHLADTPRQAFDGDGLTVRIYPDRCLLIQRKSSLGGMLTKLVPDLERKDFQHRPGDEVEKQSWVPAFIPVLAAAEQGRCLNPHPGSDFQTAYGKRDGCWIEVWRRWRDQCEHVQMFNTCNGAWDSHPNGSPRVRWTSCVH